MARAALAWGVRDLAKKTDVAANTISRIENGAQARASTLSVLRRALEDAGVEFIDAADGKGPGVRLRENDSTLG